MREERREKRRKKRREERRGEEHLLQFWKILITKQFSSGLIFGNKLCGSNQRVAWVEDLIHDIIKGFDWRGDDNCLGVFL
jgi:hypothetical protein